MDYLERACEQIDAGVFTGELLLNQAQRNMLMEYMGRWQRALAESEKIEQDFCGDCGLPGLGAQHANTRLIAATPDLLEALMRIMKTTARELVNHWEYEKSQGRGEADDQLFALAAIVKATGEVK